MPSPSLWQEMLSAPQFVRFTFPFGETGERVPTLIIKAHSLLLKYIVQGVALKLHFFATADSRFGYALHVADDPSNGVFLWSLIANEDEIAAISELVNDARCSVYLFNEACANCAWTTAQIQIDASVSRIATTCTRTELKHVGNLDEIDAILQCINDGAAAGTTTIPVSLSAEWKPLHSTFILNGVRSAGLNLLFDNEGVHQEQLAQSLLGDLSPEGAYTNTQLYDRRGNKEFTDIVLSHKYGTILVESKALSIFGRDRALPRRERLEKSIQKAVFKALSQLRGAIRTLRSDREILDHEGNLVELERTQPAHAIILVPELELLYNVDCDLVAEIKDFMKATESFLHVVDTVALFRTMQAARMISENSENITPMMAFDFYLIERAKTVASKNSIIFDVILRVGKQN